MKPAQADKLARHYAKDCPGYSQPLPPIPVEENFKVVIPDPATRENVDEELKKSCASCAMCKNFVRDDVVVEEMGWTTGLCSAFGKLILPNKQVLAARNCEFRQYGTPRRSTAGLHLLPEYEDAFNLNVDPVKAWFKNKDSIPDPRTYPTDREVSEDESKSGIR